MIFGYARVSTKEQSLERQIDSINNAGCIDIYKEKISGRKKERAISASALYQNGIPINQILKIAHIKSKATLHEYLRRKGVFK